MYSRNFAKFETVSPQKIENYQRKQGTNSVDKPNSIPIKSYSDNSAIEVFNKLGEQKENKDNTQTALLTNEISSEKEAEENISDYNDTKINDNKNKEKTRSVLNDFHKLIDIIDDDWFLVLLAISMFIFSGNETNDKLTPIALLAIMFF